MDKECGRRTGTTVVKLDSQSGNLDYTCGQIDGNVGFKKEARTGDGGEEVLALIGILVGWSNHDVTKTFTKAFETLRKSISWMEVASSRCVLHSYEEGQKNKMYLHRC